MRCSSAPRRGPSAPEGPWSRPRRGPAPGGGGAAPSWTGCQPSPPIHLPGPLTVSTTEACKGISDTGTALAFSLSPSPTAPRGPAKVTRNTAATPRTLRRQPWLWHRCREACRPGSQGCSALPHPLLQPRALPHLQAAPHPEPAALQAPKALLGEALWPAGCCRPSQGRARISPSQSPCDPWVPSCGYGPDARGEPGLGGRGAQCKRPPPHPGSTLALQLTVLLGARCPRCAGGGRLWRLPRAPGCPASPAPTGCHPHPHQPGAQGFPPLTGGHSSPGPELGAESEVTLVTPDPSAPPQGPTLDSASGGASQSS